MSKQPPPAPTASAVCTCPTIIQIVGRPGTGSLPSTIAPPDHPFYQPLFDQKWRKNSRLLRSITVYPAKKTRTVSRIGRYAI